MDSTSRDYVPFEPNTELVQEDDCDTLLVHLPGFKKEQLTLQLISSHTLRMMGERPMEDNKWSKLQKEYPIPRSCNTSKISAKFEGEVLYIRQPKLIIPALKEDKLEKPTNEAEKEPQKNATEPPQSQTTATANDSERRDEAKSRDETEAKNAEKVYSKAEKTTDAAETATPKPLEEGKKEQKGNGIKEEEKGTRKRSDEDESGDFLRSKVQMVKKTGRMMSIVVLILSAIVLGIYVKNWIKPKKDYDN